MKVRIDAHFGEYSHATLPVFADVAKEKAEEWAKKGWCFILPEEKSENKAVIETPETEAAPTVRETATMRHRRSGNAEA